MILWRAYVFIRRQITTEGTAVFPMPFCALFPTWPICTSRQVWDSTTKGYYILIYKYVSWTQNGLNVSPLSYLLQHLLKITASLSAALWLGVGHGDSSLMEACKVAKETCHGTCSFLSASPPTLCYVWTCVLQRAYQQKSLKAVHQTSLGITVLIFYCIKINRRPGQA